MRKTVTAARGARLLLLVGTLLGLAAMHTIGHESHQTGHPADPSPHIAVAPARNATVVPVPHAAVVPVAPVPHAARARVASAPHAALAPVPHAALAPVPHAALAPVPHAALAPVPHAALLPPSQDVAAPHAVGAALQAVVGCPGGCASEELLPAGGGTGGGPSGWGVCLAVLGAFAAALLLAALLSVRVRAVGPTRGGSAGAFPPPRAPPPRPVGLRLATVSVLRR
ncbi:hypothetical protein [Micromonospora echinofusca]|uniref:hypothetical protein n=1 Tax=Micromonospora echinofusca TaxID=47858 RepID=UPI0033F8A2FE